MKFSQLLSMGISYEEKVLKVLHNKYPLGKSI